MTTALYPVERFEYRTDGEMFAYKSLWKTADEMRSWVYGYISLLQCEPKQKSLDQEYQILLKKRPVDASILKSIVERLKYEREIIREHLSKSFTDHPQMEIRAEALAAVEGLGESLDENSKIILQAMYELKCNELNRMSAGEIITTALYKGDEKRCFNQLKRLELVATKQGRNGGCWLTTKGSSIASKLNGGTVIPTDCTV